MAKTIKWRNVYNGMTGTMTEAEWAKIQNSPNVRGKLKIERLQVQGRRPTEEERKKGRTGADPIKTPPEALAAIDWDKQTHESLDQIIDDEGLKVDKTLNRDPKIDAIRKELNINQ